MPSIRIDNAISLVIISMLALCLWFCKVQIIELQKEIDAMRADLRGSLIYKFPENKGYEIPEDAPK